jgi:hypothetical protein
MFPPLPDPEKFTIPPKFAGLGVMESIIATGGVLAGLTLTLHDSFEIAPLFLLLYR